MKKPKTQYRITTNGIDYRIQRLEDVFFGLTTNWQNIWSHGKPATFEDMHDAAEKIRSYIEHARVHALTYEPVSANFE